MPQVKSLLKSELQATGTCACTVEVSARSAKDTTVPDNAIRMLFLICGAPVNERVMHPLPWFIVN